MADSLFDNRYRYDYIYPRGRSGETLRAVDTQEGDRPVVIKRPAPNDAPPIRAGQEVSILNERKALTRLAGHPIATALLGSGQFVVGGVAHQYIVMERGEGVLVADLVRELSQRGERLPELEMLVIADHLLDLLQAAHAKDVVYNDVDAKHLFWDRDQYRLKVIDWGNAVFLEGDEITPQGISRQTDVFQVGELLYFIVSGGGRADVPRDAGDDFLLSFGPDAERISPRLGAIISKAVHPSTKLRYRSITELRKALTDYRDPMERERNAIIGRVNDRLRQNRSREELEGLLETVSPALAADPGHPGMREAHREILARLRDLEVEADLDAARIYLESGSWARAVDLLDELRGKARDPVRGLAELLYDLASVMDESKIQPMPPAVADALYLIFEGQNARAAHLLVTTPATDQARAVQWLAAERISAHTPDVLLLRPNLYRLDNALALLAADGVTVTEPRAVLAEIRATLDRISASSAASLIELRDGYRSVVDGLTALGALLETVNVRHNLPDDRLPLSALERALNAAMTLADNMHVIGRQVTTSPRDATNALDASRAIDPTSPCWDAVGRMMNGLYELLGTYQTYVPAADGSDLEGWLISTRTDLQPFRERLFDDLLAEMISGLETASLAWAQYGEATVQGNRQLTLESLTVAIDSVTTISPTLAGWLNQVRTICTNAQYIERHALYGGLGRALADGWEAFDRGRLSDAERLGQQAMEIARSDAQRFAARRLRDLAEQARGWQERNMVNSARGTQVALAAVEKLHTSEENAIRENFTVQMPSKDTYLRAMGKGLVELYSRASTAAPRILFVNSILLGTLDAHDGKLEDADFWREAALRALPDLAERHPLTRLLTDFVERRRDLNAGAALLNAIHRQQALTGLESTRKRLEENPQARTLAAGILSLRELDAAVRNWSDGEFRSAGIKLENALKSINDVELAASITLTQYRSWLMELQAGAAELHNQYRQVTAAVEGRPDKPPDILRTAHRRMVDVTERLLGEAYAATLRAWRDTYESFLGVYSDQAIRRSEKLSRFNELFKAMFIDRHPAYPLYRHWYELTDHAPEFPAPPTDEPTPRITDESFTTVDEYRGTRYQDETPAARPAGRISRRALVVGAGALLLLIALAVLAAGGANQGAIPTLVVTITNTPGQGAAAVGTEESTPGTDQSPATSVTLTDSRAALPSALPFSQLATATLVPSSTPRPSLPPPPLFTPDTEVPPTATLTITPSATWTPSVTPTETATPTITPTSTATLPPGGLQGDQDLLRLFPALDQLPWSPDDFSLVNAIDTTYWRLGSSEPGQTDLITIALPPDLLEARYGGQAASRIRRVEVELTLTTFNPALVSANQVFYGVMLREAGNPSVSAGLHLQLVQPGIISLQQRAGESLTPVSQRSVSVYVARIRLERDLTNGSISVFFNGDPVGGPIRLTGIDAALEPVLYVRRGGVIVSVTNWKITLR